MAESEKEQKERLEKEKGKGGMTVGEAGHLGGEKTAETHGHEFYEKIGHKGGHRGGQKVKELIEKGEEEEKSK
jgi:hypothetical protein